MDIVTEWKPQLACGDWVLQTSATPPPSELATALYISLFTDREADPDDLILDGTQNKRGWWGDAGAERKIGSRLWLLARANKTNETLSRAKDYIGEALQWMIDDGLINNVDITVQFQDTGMLAIQLTAYQPTDKSNGQTFNWLWR